MKLAVHLIRIFRQVRTKHRAHLKFINHIPPVGSVWTGEDSNVYPLTWTNKTRSSYQCRLMTPLHNGL